MFPALISLQRATVDSSSVETTAHACLITDSIIMHVYMDKGANLTLKKQQEGEACAQFSV